MKKFIFCLVTILVFALTAGSLHASDIKVACIDSQKVMTESKAGKNAFKQLSALKERKEAEAKKRQGKLNELKKSLTSQSMKMNDQAKERIAAQYQQEIRAYERFIQDSKDELRKTENRILTPWSRELDDIVKTYAEKNGIDLVLDKSTFVFTTSRNDITGEIMEIFNRVYDERTGKKKVKK